MVRNWKLQCGAVVKQMTLFHMWHRLKINQWGGSVITLEPLTIGSRPRFQGAVVHTCYNMKLKRSLSLYRMSLNK